VLNNVQAITFKIKLPVNCAQTPV